MLIKGKARCPYWGGVEKHAHMPCRQRAKPSLGRPPTVCTIPPQKIKIKIETHPAELRGYYARPQVASHQPEAAAIVLLLVLAAVLLDLVLDTLVVFVLALAKHAPGLFLRADVLARGRSRFCIFWCVFGVCVRGGNGSYKWTSRGEQGMRLHV